MSLHLWGPNDNIILLILSVEGTGRLVCIPPILVGASLQVGVTFLMRRILKPCNWRLIIWRGSCFMSGEGELLPILTSLLKMRSMVVIDPGQGLLLVSLSCMMKTTIISVEAGIHLLEAWEMMQWAKHSTKFPNHLSRVELKEWDFLGGSLSPHSPCVTVKQTLWSM